MQRFLLASAIALVLATAACASDTDEGNDKTVEIKDPTKTDDKSTTDKPATGTDTVHQQATDSPLYSPKALATDSPLY